MSSPSPTRGPVESPCVACGASLKDVPRGQNCPTCGTPWTSPVLRFFWRLQVIGVVVIPLMFIGGTVWLIDSDSDSQDWPGRFLLLAFILAALHLGAGIVWNTVVPEYHRPKGTGRIMLWMLIFLLIVGILLPALGRC